MHQQWRPEDLERRKKTRTDKEADVGDRERLGTRYARGSPFLARSRGVPLRVADLGFGSEGPGASGYILGMREFGDSSPRKKLTPRCFVIKRGDVAHLHCRRSDLLVKTV